MKNLSFLSLLSSDSERSWASPLGSFLQQGECSAFLWGLGVRVGLWKSRMPEVGVQLKCRTSRRLANSLAREAKRPTVWILPAQPLSHLLDRHLVSPGSHIQEPRTLGDVHARHFPGPYLIC